MGYQRWQRWERAHRYRVTFVSKSRGCLIEGVSRSSRGG